MASTVTAMHRLLALSLISISIGSAKLGEADEGFSQAGATVEDPSQIVAKALLCFNEKDIYSSCEEAYRLDQSGNLNVPPEHTDQYCNGPCLAETNLVLTCIEHILLHFEFYNKATIEDIRGTIKAGCSAGSQRGNFNVEKHMQAEQSKTEKFTIPITVGIVGMILVHGLLL